MSRETRFWILIATALVIAIPISSGIGYAATGTYLQTHPDNVVSKIAAVMNAANLRSLFS